jgi:hypothetical protein
MVLLTTIGMLVSTWHVSTNGFYMSRLTCVTGFHTKQISCSSRIHLGRLKDSCVRRYSRTSGADCMNVFPGKQGNPSERIRGYRAAYLQGQTPPQPANTVLFGSARFPKPIAPRFGRRVRSERTFTEEYELSKSFTCRNYLR